MTLHEFSADVLPIINSIIAIIGLASVILLYRQMQFNYKWNKRMSNFTIQTWQHDELENEVVRNVQEIGINMALRDVELTEEEVDKIIHNEKAYLSLMSFLDKIEYYCTAIKCGLVDDTFAYNMYGVKYIQLFKVYSPFIMHIRSHYKDDSIYVEFAKINDEFSEKRNKEAKERRKNIGAKTEI